MATKSDAQINQDVFDELNWDPAIQVADLNIATSDGRVTLTGTVHNYGTKEEATEAAYRVNGVRAVENELEVNPSQPDIRSDSAIADSIRNALLLDYQVPYQRINVEVSKGHVTLAEQTAWKSPGVTEVTNNIKANIP